MTRTIASILMTLFFCAGIAVAQYPAQGPADLRNPDASFLGEEPVSSGGNAYYVAPNGNDDWEGTLSRPFKTLQWAADVAEAGDTVWVRQGTYRSPTVGGTVLFISKRGTPTQWIRFRSYDSERPVIHVDENWGGITIEGGAYIEIDGFVVVGNNDNITLEYALSQGENLNNPLTSGNGISVTMGIDNGSSPPAQIISHHIIIRNCMVTMCGGGGIGTKGSDYVKIIDNDVSFCGWYSPYANSGITNYLNANFDSSTKIKMVVRDNWVYGNRNYVPHYYSGSTPSQRVITDGNGIIIDDTRNIQNGIPTPPYKGITLVDRNHSFENGGRGLVAYLADRVIFNENRSWGNALTGGVIIADAEINYSATLLFYKNYSAPYFNIPELSINNTTGSYIVDWDGVVWQRPFTWGR